MSSSLNRGLSGGLERNLGLERWPPPRLADPGVAARVAWARRSEAHTHLLVEDSKLLNSRRKALQRLLHQTGIRLKLLPGPERSS